MCGRFVRTSSLEEVVEAFQASGSQHLNPSFNIPPTTPVYVIRHDETHRLVEPMLWGLVPFWAKDRSRASNAINARSETITEKPSFRHLVSSHRAVMPLDGYFEWNTVSPKPSGPKQPFLVSPRLGGELDHSGMFAAAALWSSWGDPNSDGEVLHTVAMVTTESHGELAAIHHRMPLLLNREETDEWLDPITALPPWVTSPRRDPEVAVRAVSTRVNSVRNNDATLIEPVVLEEGQERLF